MRAGLEEENEFHLGIQKELARNQLEKLAGAQKV